MDPHAYYDRVSTLPYCTKAYSLRSPSQLKQYSQSQTQAPSYTYTPLTDPYATPQDAAKGTIPLFITAGITLAQPVAAGDTVMVVSKSSGLFVINRQFRLGSEIVTVLTNSTQVTTIPISRGTFSTPIAAHAAGTLVECSNNSIDNQIRLPVDGARGATWFLVWDQWIGPECVPPGSGLKSWKNWQLSVGTQDSRWAETRLRFSLATPGALGPVDVRYYGHEWGPNVSKVEPLAPQVNQFMVMPSRWTRYFYLFDMLGEWDLTWLWVADELTDPVLLLDGLQLRTGSGLAKLWAEQNTSTDRLTGNQPRGDLVLYADDVCVLKNPPPEDLPGLLTRPGRGSVPSAVRNVQVVF